MKWWQSPTWTELARGLALTPEEGFVLSLLRSPVTPEEIVVLSGLPLDRVESILLLLFDKGLAETDEQPYRAALETIPDLDEPSAALRARATLESSEDITIERGPKREAAPIPVPTPDRAFEPVEAPAPAPAPPSPSPSPSTPPSGGLSRPPSNPIAFAPMLEAYALSIKEGVSEATRESAREWIRAAFLAASPESRAAFLWDSEGHTLPALAHVPFDARVAKILCAKTFTSQMLVTNLARCATCPAPLLAHLLRQPIVKRNPQVRRALLNHPNTPAEIRRKG